MILQELSYKDAHADTIWLMASSRSWLSRLAWPTGLRPRTPDANVPVVAPDKTSQIYSIQYVRGFAALLVVLYHQAIYIERMRGEVWLHDIVQGQPGLYGVIAFFVLSGFLMAEIAPRHSATTFLVHRIIRIYPAYWGGVVLAYFFSERYGSCCRPTHRICRPLGRCCLAMASYRPMCSG